MSEALKNALLHHFEHVSMLLLAFTVAQSNFVPVVTGLDLDLYCTYSLDNQGIQMPRRKSLIQTKNLTTASAIIPNHIKT